jgi:hypothetical protein
VKKKDVQKKKPSMTNESDRKRSISFTWKELFLVARVYTKVSSNAKHGTNKKAETFWDDIHLHCNEFIATSNKINESNLEYLSIDARNAESLHLCWQQRLQLRLFRNLPDLLAGINLFLVRSWETPWWISTSNEFVRFMQASLIHTRRMCQETSQRAWKHITSFCSPKVWGRDSYWWE